MDYTKYQNKLPYPNRNFGTLIERTQMLRAYKNESADLEALFKADLEEEYGTKDNPRKDVLYRKAYDLGHSYGYQSVEAHYSELVELIEPLPDGKQ